MYEEKSRKLDINWKSLLIKMIILLFAVFILLWLISLVNKSKTSKPSNIDVNLKQMQAAATEYFTESRLPESINGTKKVTLQEMFDSKLLIEFKDQNNNSCDTSGSYAEATKITTEDYSIKVKLVCSDESKYSVTKVTLAKSDDLDVDDNPDNSEDNNNTIVDNTEINNTPNNTNTNNSSNNTSSNISNNTSNSTTKPSTNNTTNNTTNTVTTSCTYGNKEYTNYTLSYEIPGNCAVSKSDYNNANYSNAASTFAATEYQKLVREMSVYSNVTVESPSFTGVYNKTNTGLVGYQILFTVKRKTNYVLETIYQYYLNKDGSRKVIIDRRSSLTNSSSTSNNTSNSTNGNTSSSNTTIVNTKITLDKNSLSLTEGESYTLKATVTPSTSTSIRWTSSNTTIATVNSNGLVTARKAGTATISAEVNNTKVSINVYVSSLPTSTYCKKVVQTDYFLTGEVANSYTAKDLTLKYTKTDMKDVVVINAGYLQDSQYTSAREYFYNPRVYLAPGYSLTNYNVPTNYKNYALTIDNFWHNITQTYQKNGSWYIDVSYKVNNYNNVTPYNYSSTKKIYYIPLFFTIEYTDLGNCVNIPDSEASNYRNYKKI